MLFRLFLYMNISMSFVACAFESNDLTSSAQMNNTIHSDSSVKSINTTDRKNIIEANTKKINSLLLTLHQIEDEFKQIHGYYEPEAIGFINMSRVKEQVNKLSYQEKLNAKKELAKIIVKISKLRQQLVLMPTAANSYSNGRWLYLITLKDDVPRLMTTINLFEYEITKSLQNQERVRKNSASQ